MTLIKSKMITNLNPSTVIKTDALKMLEVSRGALVTQEVLENMKLKDFTLEVTQGEHPLQNNELNSVVPEPTVKMDNEIYGKPQENVNLEETPAQMSMGDIAGPSVEEINKLRAVIADASNQVTILQNRLDELQQMLQLSLDKEHEYSTGIMKM